MTVGVSARFGEEEGTDEGCALAGRRWEKREDELLNSPLPLPGTLPPVLVVPAVPGTERGGTVKTLPPPVVLGMLTLELHEPERRRGDGP